MLNIGCPGDVIKSVAGGYRNKLFYTPTHRNTMLFHMYGPALKHIDIDEFKLDPIKTRRIDDLTIILIHNKRNPLTAMSLRHIGVSFVERQVEKWSGNRRRNLIYRQIVEKCDTPYVMGLDASDVLVAPNISNVVSRFLRHDCKFLMSAERLNSPKDFCGVEELKSREQRDGSGYECLYGCAGMWMGEKDCVLEVLDRVCLSIYPEHPRRDQHLYREAVTYFDFATLDYDSSIFLNYPFKKNNGYIE